MVLGRLKRLFEPGDRAVLAIIEDAPVDVETQRSAAASYAVARGIKIVETVAGSRVEVAEKLLSGGVEAGKVLVFDPQLLGEDVVEELEARGVKVVRARLEGREGPSFGC